MQGEKVGIWLSIACAVHCAAMPLVLTLTPLAGLEVLHSLWAEALLLGVGFFFGGRALWNAYRHGHGNVQPLLMGLAGFVLVVLGLFVAEHELEPWLVGGGALLVGIAQIFSVRQARHCNTCAA